MKSITPHPIPHSQCVPASPTVNAAVNPAVNRRRFTSAAAIVSAVAAVSSTNLAWADEDSDAAGGPAPWLRKSVKLGMIQQGTMAERFEMAKAAGFAGIEPNVPVSGDFKGPLLENVTIQEINRAIKQTGIPVDGTVGGYHWSQRHSDPDPKVREVAQQKLIRGLRETRAMGGDTMLLVPGHGQDGTEAEVIKRSSEAIRAALPVAKELDVKILIENVWNRFLYVHDGPDDQSAKPLADYIDSFESPYVAIQFDIGNHWKYGDPAKWIRTLGSRIVKLDIKGFSRQKNKFTDITEGDIRWDEVREALREIGFRGWVAAEVGGGKLQRLTKVAKQMEQALRCNDPVNS